ncbi:cobalamin synthase [Firmicutes bacterium CAG:238]|nr:cobalamin synthase [Firmicutes bacterium CAG:238]
MRKESRLRHAKNQMKYLTGFMMAWGNFCSLPCPAKHWDNNYTSLMLGFLPLIGLVIGIIWSAIYFGLVYLGFPFFVVAFLITFLPFALCGFMHMDGFMDCCDAIMSRRPLEQRQLILKDSSTGAFAVVGMIFFVLGYFCFLSTAVTTGVDFANMVMIVVMSRSISGLHVLICKPMGQSQYAMLHDAEPPEETLPEETLPEEEPTEESTTEEDCTELVACDSVETASKKASAKSGVILLLVLLAVITALAFWCSSLWLATLIVSAATALGSLISIQYAKKNLGGMSGDIAGFGIIWGELMGVFALVLC